MFADAFGLLDWDIEVCTPFHSSLSALFIVEIEMPPLHVPHCAISRLGTKSADGHGTVKKRGD